MSIPEPTPEVAPATEPAPVPEEGAEVAPDAENPDDTGDTPAEG